jgi:ubiquinone/menaquinone biosynthesis C-methylase UbiE
MKKTDYQKIARVYDANTDRHNIPKDKTLQALVGGAEMIRVLDLACGTGNNLKLQSEHFGNSYVEWHGVDLSPEMLEIAREKVPYAKLSVGNAEFLDYEDGYFEYICCNFAFHQFENKQRVMDAIQRLVKSRGAFKIRNVASEYMKNWWVYQYCPEAYFQDLHRFWSKDLIVFELEKRGFRANVSVTYEEKGRSLQTIISEYIRRDNSQLANASETAYHAGLVRLEKEMSLGVSEVKSDFALIEIEAMRA